MLQFIKDLPDDVIGILATGEVIRMIMKQC